jgi:hypothetical protein
MINVFNAIQQVTEAYLIIRTNIYLSYFIRLMYLYTASNSPA